MRDQELEQILRGIGQEQFAPPPDLVHKTKQRIRRSHLLPVLVLVSLCMQLMTVGGAVCLVFHPDIAGVVKAYGLFGFSVLLSLSLLPLLGIRAQLRVCVERLQESYG